MPEQSLGTIVLRLLVDNKAFKEGLAGALQLVQITSQQIKDLAQFKIPEPDIHALDLALEAGEARIRDFLVTANEPKANPPVIPPEVPASYEQHTRKVSEGERALRQFFQEQRLQDRVTNQARQSILALTSSLGFLNIGNANASGTTKALQESMLAGIGTANGLEFALFGLGQVGGKLPGMFGAIAAGAASMAGPIAAAVGAGALLITFFQKSNEEAQKAVSEGLRDFEAALSRLSRPQTLRLAEGVKEQIDLINKEIDRLKTGRAFQFISAAGDVVTVQRFNEEEAKRLALLNRDQEILSEILRRTKQQREEAETLLRAQQVQEDNLLKIGTEIQKQDILIKRLNQEIETRVDAEKETALTVEQIRAKMDELNRLEAARARNLRSTLDMLRQNVSELEVQHQLGQVYDQQLIDALEALHQQQIEQGLIVEALQTELKLQQTLQQMAADDVVIAETKHRLGLATIEDVRKALEAQLNLAKSEKDRIAIQEKLHQLNITQAETEVALADKAFQRGLITSEMLIEKLRNLQSVTKEVTKQAELEERIIAAQATELSNMEKKRELQNAFNRKLFELSQIAIEDEFEARTAAENRRFEEEKKAIEEQYAIAFVREDGLIQLSEEGQRLRNENDRAHEAALAAIKRDRIQALHDLEMVLLGDSFAAELQRIDDFYNEQERRARILYKDKDQLDAALAQLRRRRSEDIAAAELANVQRTLGAAQNLMGSIVSVAQALERPAEGFVENLQKALAIAQAIVATLQAMEAISLFFGLAGGGMVPPASTRSGERVQYAATGMRIPGGSFVVKKAAAEKNKPLLQALGAQEVTGGTPGRDSVAAVTPEGTVVMMMPGEMIVEPRFAPIAAAINEGRVRMLAGGGRIDPFQHVVEIAAQLQRDGLNPGGLPIPASVVQQVRMEISGGFNKEVLDALIDEVRGLRVEINEMKAEVRTQTSEVRGQTEAFKSGLRTDIDNGKMFFRKHLPDALSFEKERSA
jgi:hypothetical protein